MKALIIGIGYCEQSSNPLKHVLGGHIAEKFRLNCFYCPLGIIAFKFIIRCEIVYVLLFKEVSKSLIDEFCSLVRADLDGFPARLHQYFLKSLFYTFLHFSGLVDTNCEKTWIVSNMYL